MVETGRARAVTATVGRRGGFPVERGTRTRAGSGAAGETDAADGDGSEAAVSGAGKADFDTFYRREHARVLKHALWLVGDLTVAEDLTQDAFIAAHRRWGEVSGLDWPAGWVQRVVSNRSVSRYRRAVRENRLVTTLGRRRAAPVAVDEDRTDLWDAVRRLPARQAQAIALVYGAGYTVAESAVVLGCGRETVKTHLARGRAALAAALGTDDGRGPDRRGAA